jgi:hypothetical protein
VASANNTPARLILQFVLHDALRQLTQPPRDGAVQSESHPPACRAGLKTKSKGLTRGCDEEEELFSLRAFNR